VAARGARALAGGNGEAESKGRGKGVMFGVGQCCMYVCRLEWWWWWVEDSGCHCSVCIAAS